MEEKQRKKFQPLDKDDAEQDEVSVRIDARGKRWKLLIDSRGLGWKGWVIVIGTISAWLGIVWTLVTRLVEVIP